MLSSTCGDQRYSRKPSSPPIMLSIRKPKVPPSVMPMNTVEVDWSIKPTLSSIALTVSEKAKDCRHEATVPRLMVRALIFSTRSGSARSCTVPPPSSSPASVHRLGTPTIRRSV